MDVLVINPYWVLPQITVFCSHLVEMIMLAAILDVQTFLLKTNVVGIRSSDCLPLFLDTCPLFAIVLMKTALGFILISPLCQYLITMVMEEMCLLVGNDWIGTFVV